MVLGVDFDNTIVCYDEVFRRAAAQRRLIPAGANLTKRQLHDFLHESSRADVWTELQGEVYGPLMPQAAPFPGVLDFFRRCHAAGIDVRIISHRTRYPYLGPRHDLHQAARDWLVSRKFHDPEGIALPAERVFFEISRAEKLARIASERCTHFVEDLVDVLSEPDFPQEVSKILFDPDGMHPDFTLTPRADSWAAVARLLKVE